MKKNILTTAITLFFASTLMSASVDVSGNWKGSLKNGGGKFPEGNAIYNITADNSVMTISNTTAAARITFNVNASKGVKLNFEPTKLHTLQNVLFEGKAGSNLEFFAKAPGVRLNSEFVVAGTIVSFSKDCVLQSINNGTPAFTVKSGGKLAFKNRIKFFQANNYVINATDRDSLIFEKGFELERNCSVVISKDCKAGSIQIPAGFPVVQLRKDSKLILNASNAIKGGEKGAQRHVKIQVNQSGANLILGADNAFNDIKFILDGLTLNIDMGDKKLTLNNGFSKDSKVGKVMLKNFSDGNLVIAKLSESEYTKVDGKEYGILKNVTADGSFKDLVWYISGNKKGQVVKLVK